MVLPLQVSIAAAVDRDCRSWPHRDRFATWKRLPGSAQENWETKDSDSPIDVKGCETRF